MSYESSLTEEVREMLISNLGGIGEVKAASGNNPGGPGVVANPPNVNPENPGEKYGAAQLIPKLTAPIGKNIFALAPGEIFAAEILDIQPGAITLKLEDGNLTAKSLSVPDARIGDRAMFMVKENRGGQIALEFMRDGPQFGQVSESIVKEALQAARMQYTMQNAEIVADLVKHNLPIDDKTIQQAAFFRYSMPDVTFEKVAFLIENEFAPIERTTQVFTSLSDGSLNLRNEMQQLMQFALAMDDGDMGKNLADRIVRALSVNIDQGQDIPAQMQNFFGEAATLLEEFRGLYEGAGEDFEKIRTTMENIRDILDFSRNITNTKYYMQFPFLAEMKDGLAQLHVFQRKGQRHAKGKEASTAMMALDMAHLGHVEVLVHRQGKGVSLQFRADENKALGLIGAHAPRLNDALGEKGYNISNLAFKRVSEKFDISDTPQKDGAPSPDSQPPRVIKRYSFDMRV